MFQIDRAVNEMISYQKQDVKILIFYQESLQKFHKYLEIIVDDIELFKCAGFISRNILEYGFCAESLVNMNFSEKVADQILKNPDVIISIYILLRSF